MDDSLLSYVHIPPGAHRVQGPSSASAAYRARLASFPPAGEGAGGGAKGAIRGAGKGKDAERGSGTGAGSGSAGPGGFLANSMSDMFLSSILPSSIPSRPDPASATGSHSASASSHPFSNAPQHRLSLGSGPNTPSRPRPLTTQREPLSLQAMTTTFRRFVARCGPVFWALDRVEEVVYWRKPVWTLAWIVGWGFLCRWWPYMCSGTFAR